MLWKIYFWIITGLSILSILILSSHTPWNLGEWYGIFSSLISVFALYVFVYKKQLGKPELWRALFYIEVVVVLVELIYLFTPIRTLIPIPEALQSKDSIMSGNLFIIGLLLSLPYYYAIFQLGQFNKKTNNLFSLIVSVLILLTIAGTFLFLLKSEGKVEITSHGIKSISTGPCSRKHPYEMSAQIVEALSIVRSKSPLEVRNTLEPIVNCLNVQYKDLSKDKGLVEGAFSIDKSSTLDNLRIYIDNSFQTKSTEFVSLILAHEVIHAIYLVSDIYYKNPPVTCATQEYEAWGNEVLLMYNGFTNEQKSNINNEINSFYKTDVHALALSNFVLEINKSLNLCKGAKTEKELYECKWNNVRYVVQNKVDSSPSYKVQCGF